MRKQPNSWFVPVFLGVILVAAGAAAACGHDPASRVLLNAADTTSGDTIPNDSIPGDSVPPDTVPRPDTLPPTPPGARLVLSPASQDRAVGDSGTVSATVFDSTGQVVRSAVIDWDLSETGTVVRIRARGVSYVAFDAVGTGRAVIIGRYQHLADTALVFVR
jgi:hypothetical protein